MFVTVGDLQVGMSVDAVAEVLTIRYKLVDPKKLRIKHFALRINNEVF